MSLILETEAEADEYTMDSNIEHLPYEHWINIEALSCSLLSEVII